MVPDVLSKEYRMICNYTYICLVPSEKITNRYFYDKLFGQTIRKRQHVLMYQYLFCVGKHVLR